MVRLRGGCGVSNERGLRPFRSVITPARGLGRPLITERRPLHIEIRPPAPETTFANVVSACLYHFDGNPRENNINVLTGWGNNKTIKLFIAIQFIDSSVTVAHGSLPLRYKTREL